MFNDFHESIRGVGVVGMLLGLLVLAGFCGLGMAVLSGQGDRGPTIGMRLADQERRMMFVSGSLKGSKAELADARRAQEMLTINTGKFTLASEKLAVEEKLMGEAEVIATSLKEDLDGIQLDFEEYRDQYRVNERGLAVGETLDFSETKGDAFKSCKVSKITPLNVHVMRSTGPIGIPYKELPSEIQDRFQFGEEEAQIYQNKLDASRQRWRGGFLQTPGMLAKLETGRVSMLAMRLTQERRLFSLLRIRPSMSVS